MLTVADESGKSDNRDVDSITHIEEGKKMAKAKKNENNVIDETSDAAPEETAEQPPAEEAAAPAPVVDHPAAVDVVSMAKDLKVLHAAVRWLVATRSPTEQQEFYLAFPALKL
jgi:hypothetical protein